MSKDMPCGDWVTRKQAAQIVGLKRGSVWHWLKKHEINTRVEPNAAGGGICRLYALSEIKAAMNAPPKPREKPPLEGLDVAAHREAWAEHLRSMPQDRRRLLFDFAQQGARWLLSPAVCERLMDLDPDSPDEDDSP